MHSQNLGAALLLASGALLTPPPTRAEEPGGTPGASAHALRLSIGLGFVYAERPRGQPAPDGYGKGAYVEGDYVLWPESWFSPRVYAGTVIAPVKRGSCGGGVVPCDVSAQYVFAGAKARLLVPIPWVAPYLELGLGGSLGAFSTQSGQAVDETTKGLAYHIPVGLGLALGRRREFEFALQYLYHTAQKQFSGAFALGVQFALD